MSHIFDDCNTYLVCFGSFVTIAGNLINARLLEKTTSFSMHDDQIQLIAFFKPTIKGPLQLNGQTGQTPFAREQETPWGKKKKITSFKRQFPSF